MSQAKHLPTLQQPPPPQDVSQLQGWGNWLPGVLGLGCAPGGETPQGVCCTCDEDVGFFQQGQAASPQRGAYAVHTFAPPQETPGMPDYVPAHSPVENPMSACQTRTVQPDSESAKLVAAEKGQRAKANLEKASQNVKAALKQVSGGECPRLIWHPLPGLADIKCLAADRGRRGQDQRNQGRHRRNSS